MSEHVVVVVGCCWYYHYYSSTLLLLYFCSIPTPTTLLLLYCGCCCYYHHPFPSPLLHDSITPLHRFARSSSRLTVHRTPTHSGASSSQTHDDASIVYATPPTDLASFLGPSNAHFLAREATGRPVERTLCWRREFPQNRSGEHALRLEKEKRGPPFARYLQSRSSCPTTTHSPCLTSSQSIPSFLPISNCDRHTRPDRSRDLHIPVLSSRRRGDESPEWSNHASVAADSGRCVRACSCTPLLHCITHVGAIPSDDHHIHRTSDRLSTSPAALDCPGSIRPSAAEQTYPAVHSGLRDDPADTEPADDCTQMHCLEGLPTQPSSAASTRKRRAYLPHE